MKLVLIGVGGVVVHVLSHVLAQYAQWLFGKVLRGDVIFVFVEDLKQFVRWLLRGVAGQYSERRGWSAEEHDWQPELYGA
jgi:hypothetical protein